MMLVGQKAQEYFDNAVEEFSGNEVGEYLKQNVRGYWFSEKDQCFIAFDNFGHEELFVEEFDSKEKAEKYAKGIMVTDHNGFEI